MSNISVACDLVRRNMHPISRIEPNKDYDALLRSIGDCQLVLIGEASHGTHEFYAERAKISKLLIEQKGFNIIAVESDWPDAYRINRFIHGISKDTTARDSLASYQRFPLWMWRNQEVLEFIEFLSEYNSKRDLDKQVSWYGMDLYSLYTSAMHVIEYLQRVDPPAAKRAKQRYATFMMFGEDTQSYGYASSMGLTPSCEEACIKVLQEMLDNASRYLKMDGYIAMDELFFNTQNALVVTNAERYYRAMFRSRDLSWNLRDEHMAQTLHALVRHHKQYSSQPPKLIVWAHNSHLGDARYTEMGQRRREINVGQLTREQFGEDNVYNIGFTTHTGKVIAATDWDEPWRERSVNDSLPDSIEYVFHQTARLTKTNDFLLMFNRKGDKGKEPYDFQLTDELAKPRLQRAIGVVYRPETERWSHYFSAKISKQFDAVIHIEKTTALKPLDRASRMPYEDETVPETYPEGV